MDAEIKRKWIADLRSGQFQQVNGFLHHKEPSTGYGYCCLGVLCVSVGAEFSDWSGFDEETADYSSFGDVPVLDGDILSVGEDQELSPSFIRDIGLSQEDQKTLIKMNDDGVPFADIADYIEKNL